MALRKVTSFSYRGMDDDDEVPPFRDMFDEPMNLAMVAESAERMRDRVKIDAVNHKLIHPRFTESYIKIIDGLEMHIEGLLGIYKNGAVRFVVTRQTGISGYFIKQKYSDVRVLTVDNIEWIFDSSRIDEVVEEHLAITNSFYKQVACSYVQ
jgi:hypothetical protein